MTTFALHRSATMRARRPIAETFCPREGPPSKQVLWWSSTSSHHRRQCQPGCSVVRGRRLGCATVGYAREAASALAVGTSSSDTSAKVLRRRSAANPVSMRVRGRLLPVDHHGEEERTGRTPTVPASFVGRLQETAGTPPVNRHGRFGKVQELRWSHLSSGEAPRPRRGPMSAAVAGAAPARPHRRAT